MKTVRRLFYADIVSAVTFVALAFLSLSFFIDFIDQLSNVGQGEYTIVHATLYSLLLVPGHFYEVAPIAVLIGTIYTLSQLAQSSEYTILRTGGLGPGRALSLLASLGLIFGLLTFVVGDYLAPLSERQAAQLQALQKGGIRLGRSGAWLKDHGSTPEGERSYSINVGSAGPGALLNDIRIFEFDADGGLLRRIAATSAQVQANSVWSLCAKRPAARTSTSVGTTGQPRSWCWGLDVRGRAGSVWSTPAGRSPQRPMNPTEWPKR